MRTLVLTLALLIAPLAASAQRTVSIDVVGISILGTSSPGSYCVGFTDAGPPVSTTTCPPINIPTGSTPNAAATAIEASINACLPVAGVVSVSRSGFMVDVIIDGDADAYGFECVDVPDHTINFSISGPYTGGFSKGTVDISKDKIVVPDNNRACRFTQWSVTNSSGSAFPANAQIIWDLNNLTHCGGRINTGALANNLGNGLSIGPFQIGLKITSNNPGKVDKGFAYPRPNFDPPFDDPLLDEMEITEGEQIPAMGNAALLALLVGLVGAASVVFYRRRVSDTP